MADQVIRIVVQTTGVRTSTDGLRGMGSQAKATATAVQLLKRGLALLGVGSLARAFVELSDTFIGLQNRVRTVTDNFAQTKAVMTELFGVARQTRSDFGATAETFARLSASSKVLGFSQAELLKVTKSINQAIILSGATAREAKTGLIQLSQGFARGVLRGDELRSVLEQMPVVADVIAKKFGVTRFAIARLGEQGKITSEIMIEAFQDMEQNLDEAFAKTIPTIGQAFNVLADQVVQMIGAFNEGTGASEAISRAILELAQNLDLLLASLKGIAIFMAGRYVQSALAATSATQRFTQALALVTKGNVIGLTITLLIAAVSAVIAFKDEISLSSDGVVKLGDVFFVLGGAFKDAAARLVVITGTIKDGLIVSLKNVGKITRSVFGPLIASVQRLGGALVKLLSRIPFLQKGFQALKDANPFTAIAEDVRLRAQERQAAKALKEAERLAALKELEFKQERSVQSQKKIAFDEEIERLTKIKTALQGNARERKINLALDASVKKTKQDLDEGQRAAIRTLLEETEALRERNKVLDEAQGPQENLIRGTMILNQLLEEGAITADFHAKKMRELQMAALATGRDMETGLRRGLIAIQEEFGQVANLTESVLVNAFKRAEEALVDFVTTGKFSFKDLASTIIKELIRIQIRAAIIAPIANALGGAAGASGGVGGIFSSALSGLKGAFGGTPGAANGADFNVGGQGGTDSQLVAFRATPGERVQVTNKDGMQGGSRRMPNVTFNVTTPDANSFGRSQNQITSRASAFMQRQGARNN